MNDGIGIKITPKMIQDMIGISMGSIAVTEVPTTTNNEFCYMYNGGGDKCTTSYQMQVVVEDQTPLMKSWDTMKLKLRENEELGMGGFGRLRIKEAYRYVEKQRLTKGKIREMKNSPGWCDCELFRVMGATRTWLEKEPPNSITTWNDLVSKFVNRFFPPSKTTNLRNESMRFQQRFDETFSEAWDRFKDLLNKCPHRGFSPLHQIDTFYNRLNQSEQDSLNSAAGGNFLTKNTQEALTIIENKSKIQTS
ncbi:reverse transcriptase domain-containing protein [Tanacetum coccineum]